MSSDKIIKNMLDKLDDLSEAYLQSVQPIGSAIVTPKCTQALIDFTHYRMDFLHVECNLSFMGVLDTETSWKMMCYCGYVTDKLKIFDGTRTLDPRLHTEVLKWRESFKEG